MLPRQVLSHAVSAKQATTQMALLPLDALLVLLESIPKRGLCSAATARRGQ